MSIKLGLNKFEKTLISTIFLCTCNLHFNLYVFRCNVGVKQIRINIGTPTMNEIINYVANGGSIVTKHLP
jgi:hypothetical protein